MTVRHRRHYVLPDAPTGYELNPYVGLFSVITPIARTNLIINPSFETNTTSWTAIGGSIARSTTHQYHGAYSLAITPTATTNDGVRYDTVSLTSGTTYAYSAKVRGQAGVKYKLAIETTGGVELTSVVFTATGRWQWVWGFWTETSTTTRRLTLRKSGSTSTAIVYLDGAQVEACAAGEVFVTTYIDGDQKGLVPHQYPPAYLWNGTPHASTSSRSGQTRAGGRVVNLSTFMFRVLSYVGLGLAVPTLISTPHGLLDGSQFQRTAYEERRVQLNGAFTARSLAALMRARSAMYDAIARDTTGLDQPLVLTYQAYDEQRALGEPLDIVASYAGGLEQTTDNHVLEKASPSFQMFLPVFYGHDAGSSLTVQASVSNANRFIVRSPAGVWSAPSAGTGQIFAFARGLDGKIYIGGSFSNWGDANGDNIVVYDPVAGTISSLGTGANGAVTALAVLPDGRIVLGGAFTSAGGVANTNRIAVWSGSAFTALGTGGNGDVNAIVIASNGDIVAGGAFTLMGGVANTVRLARWTGAAWTALSTGATGGDVNALAFGLDGTLYITGGFTALGGTAAISIGKWDGSAFSAMGSGLDSTGKALAIGLDGKLYVGGFFTAAGGVANTGHIAVWNGGAFQALSEGLDGDVYTITVAPDGTLLLSGVFTQTGSQAVFSDSVARWTGSSFVQIGADLPGTFGTSAVTAVLATPDGSFYIGYNATGTATTEAITTVTNAGSARAYPRITFKGPSSGTARLYQLVNYTTGRAIYFSLTLNAGETAVLDLTPDNVSFVSDFQGNILSTILPGSQQSDFFLQAGANSISLFAASSTVTAVEQRRLTYAAADDVID